VIDTVAGTVLLQLRQSFRSGRLQTAAARNRCNLQACQSPSDGALRGPDSFGQFYLWTPPRRIGGSRRIRCGATTIARRRWPTGWRPGSSG